MVQQHPWTKIHEKFLENSHWKLWRWLLFGHAYFLLWNYLFHRLISFWERILSSFSFYIPIHQTIFRAIYHSTIVNKLYRRIIYPLIDARHIFAFTFYIFLFSMNTWYLEETIAIFLRSFFAIAPFLFIPLSKNLRSFYV